MEAALACDLRPRRSVLRVGDFLRARVLVGVRVLLKPNIPRCVCAPDAGRRAHRRPAATASSGLGGETVGFAGPTEILEDHLWKRAYEFRKKNIPKLSTSSPLMNRDATERRSTLLKYLKISRGPGQPNPPLRERISSTVPSSGGVG